MPRCSITWIITDTHFNHDAIIKACNRPIDVDKLMIRNMKQLCAKQDVLIHLGDVIFYNYGSLKETMDQIPCRKMLIRGNHDRKSKSWYLHNGFDFACDAMVWDDVLFTHKPADVFPSGVLFNIHGHWHNNNVENNAPKFWSPLTHFKLAVEDINYTPITLDKIKSIMQSRNST